MRTDIQNLTIETPRLILRQPTMADIDAIHAAKMSVWSDLRQWMSWTADGQETHDATVNFVTRSIGPWDDGSLMFLGFRRDNGDFAISSGLNVKFNDAGEPHLETGYWVSKDQQGQGFATETLNTLTRVAFDVFGINRVKILHFPKNEPSKRVIEKAQFKYTHTLPKAALQFSSGDMMDEIFYEHTNVSDMPPAPYQILDMRLK